MTLAEISHAGTLWHIATGRKPFFNYCVHEENGTNDDVNRLLHNFSPDIWEATISVICEKNEGLPSRTEYQRNLADAFSEKMLGAGYNVRVFDPAGQDDIGGGCGQLWFVQNWMKKNPDKAKASVGLNKKQDAVDIG